MPVRHWLLNLFAPLIAAFVTVIVSAQEPQKRLPEKPAESAQDHQSESKKKKEDDSVCVLRMTTFLIRINVSVTDGNNRPIPDLAHEDFAIFEDDVAQDIVFLFRDDSSSRFSLAFDISDYEPLKLMTRQVAHSFVRQIRPTDEVTIPQLKADSRMVRDFANDSRKLEKALGEISSNNKLIDAVAEAIESTTKVLQSPRSVAVVITDGLGLSGAASDRDAAYAILRRNTPIYFIILDHGRYGSRPVSQSRVQRTRSLLARIAENSGGLALVVNREGEISAATEQIIQRLKNQYTMGYAPNKFDGAFRYVRVTVKPKGNRKVKVSAPLGYYAVDPEKIREEKPNDK